jgi:hypothetical protein
MILLIRTASKVAIPLFQQRDGTRERPARVSEINKKIIVSFLYYFYFCFPTMLVDRERKTNRNEFVFLLLKHPTIDSTIADVDPSILPSVPEGVDRHPSCLSFISSTELSSSALLLCFVSEAVLTIQVQRGSCVENTRVGGIPMASSCTTVMRVLNGHLVVAMLSSTFFLFFFYGTCLNYP